MARGYAGRLATGASAFDGDFTTPPFVERSGEEGASEELEIFAGRYVPIAEMRQASGRDLPRPFGVAPAQPFVRSATQKLLMVIGAVFAVVEWSPPSEVD